MPGMRQAGLMLILTALAALAVWGQGFRQKSIVGRLWLGSQPAVHFAVTLQNEFGNVVAQTMTDSAGEFTFNGLAGATYRIVVAADGFQPINETVDLSASGEQASVSLFLHPVQVHGGYGSLGAHSLSAKAQRAFSTAQKLLDQGQYQQAVAPLTAGLAAAPKFAPGYVALGNAYWATRHRDKAETSWRKALALDPKQAEAAINLARLDNDRRQWPQALALLNAAPAAAHSAWPWRLEHGRAEYGLQQWPAAEADLQAAEPEAGKTNPAVYVLLSNLAIKAGRFPEARHLLEMYLQAAPQGPFAPRARAIVQQMIVRGIPDPPPAAAH